MQPNAEMISTSPINVEKSVRSDEIRSITSCRAGEIVPLAFVPLLREDRVTRGSLRIGFEMAETVHPLLNAVNVSVQAWFISHVMSSRFDGLDSFNRSYQGIPEPHNGLVIPHFPTLNFDKAAPIWKKLGVHWPQSAAINAQVVESYNLLVNHRRRSRTEKLPLRAETDVTLAEAFWKNSNFSYIQPDFDQSSMDGEVELQFANSKVWIQGIARKKDNHGIVPETNIQVQGMTSQGPGAPPETWPYAVKTSTVNEYLRTSSGGVPDVWAELAESGVKVSLANIELAKQTAAFSKLRQKFDGIDDDHIIDLLMEGIRVPDAALKQPILLDRKSTIFGYTERHAMDGANLDQSVTTGKTEVTMRFRTPPMNTGGLILITAEIVPEQLYERQWDAHLGTVDPARLPNFMRDYLDPEKVEVVTNNFADVLHDTPSAVFGYAPLNHAWRRSITRAGGKFYRPDPAAFVEDRQRFWSADQENPTLADDFYMVSDLPHTVFADTASDPFEILTLGTVNIVGNTVFGDPLMEDTNSYEEIMADVDTGRIVQTPVPLAISDETA